MKKSYQLVVFDWEGTLGDTPGHVINTLATQARCLHFGELNEKLARQYAVLGLVRAVKKLFPHLTLHQHEQLLHAVQKALISSSSDACLFPGAKALVEQISRAGLHLAIASNKGQHSLLRALQETGLQDFFRVTRAAGQSPPKPCPQMLEEIMAIFDVCASQTLMIGDSITDIEMALSVDVDAIGVDFYHDQRANLTAAGALAVFDDYSQLSQYLKLSDH